MGRFQRILYLERRARGSTRAFSCALHLAVREGARLTLAGARGPRLDRMAELARLFELAVRRFDLERGEELPAAVAAEHDLVITVGRWSRWPLGLGVVERHLIRGCGCPAWLLHPAQSPETRVVVAAVDVSLPDGDELSREVLGTAAELARGAGAELHAVHCWSVVGESLLASRSRGGSPRGAERVLSEAARSRHRRIRKLLAELDLDDSARVVLRKGKVVPELREVAWRLEADILVVGSVGRTGMGALFPGNTAERLVGRVPASLFVVPEPRGEEASAVGAPLRRRAAPLAARPGYRRWPRQGGAAGRHRVS